MNDYVQSAHSDIYEKFDINLELESYAKDCNFQKQTQDYVSFCFSFCMLIIVIKLLLSSKMYYLQMQAVYYPIE